MEELCKGSLESVYSLYPTLSRLQAIGELENIGELFSRYVIQVTVYPKTQPVTEVNFFFPKMNLKNKNYIETSHRFLSFYHSVSKLT